MVTAVMTRLVLFYGFGEEVWAPVCDAPDDAAMSEDEGTGCASNPGKGKRLISVHPRVCNKDAEKSEVGNTL